MSTKPYEFQKFMKEKEPDEFIMFMRTLGPDLMKIYEQAVSDALNRRTIDVTKLKENFPQYKRIVKMLNRLHFISQYYDKTRLKAGDWSFYDCMTGYAKGEDLYEPDMDRGMNLPKSLQHMVCNTYRCGLLAMAQYFMTEAKYIMDPQEEEPIWYDTDPQNTGDCDYDSDNEYVSNHRDKAFDKKLYCGKYTGCCIGSPFSWNAFDIIYGITHSNL